MGSAGLELQEFEEVAGSPNPGADIAALKRVIDAGLPDYVPVAAKWLAFISEQTSDVDLARTAMGAVIDSANLKYASRTAMKVGKLFTRTGHATEAIAAYRFVVDNDQEASVVAARHLGDLLAAEGDRDGARTAYEFVLARSQYPHTISDVRAALDRL
jgi:predicted negative regulator of RcsB-dependent stress response